MDIGDRLELRAALGRLRSRLGVSVPEDALAAYLAGKEPHIAAHERVATPQRQLPAVVRYMLVAEAYLAFPSVDKYYDEPRAARVVPLLRMLDVALEALLQADVHAVAPRVAKLSSSVRLDQFDATLFELVVANAYGRNLGFERLAFLPEDSATKSPEFRVDLLDDEPLFVECKRVDRFTQAAADTRDAAAALGHAILAGFHEVSCPVAVEVTFVEHPTKVDKYDLARASIASLKEDRIVDLPAAKVRTRALAPISIDSPKLCPSTGLFFELFGYESEMWNGIVPMMAVRSIGPSVIASVGFRAAMMWRVENDAVRWASQRLPFTTIFEGLEQLEVTGRHTALHVWFERDATYGHRRDQLTKLLGTLEAKQKGLFSWLIANETYVNVSNTGRFDFQEHASMLGGFLRREGKPPVSTVFVDEANARGAGEWGVGVQLGPVEEEP